MANLKNFPGRLPPPEPIKAPVPVASDVFPTFENYPGAPRSSDRAMLANVPPKERYPGDGMPGEPLAPAPAIAPRRLRRDK